LLSIIGIILDYKKAISKKFEKCIFLIQEYFEKVLIDILVKFVVIAVI